ncbi:hypothetical protein SAMN05444272_1038 [Roseibium suaedae]|uniref:Uncharacterized protein n=1 Tax=Roseibium suaedae TaxID=735517 RepID=A0A1M7C1C9_9HYPH|nr:hypothetical protein SAMN05444272_1038 [Roseibium suaedae]
MAAILRKDVTPAAGAAGEPGLLVCREVLKGGELLVKAVGTDFARSARSRIALAMSGSRISASLRPG